MVLSLRSFTLSCFVNFSASWSHGSFIEIIHSVLLCEWNLLWICYIIWILNRLCDFLSCVLLGSDCEQLLFCSYHTWTRNTMCFVLNMSGILKRWCDALSCAPLGYDCEQSLFAVITLELVMKHVRILKRWCDALFCAPSSYDCEGISFCNGYKWTCNLSYGPFFLCSFKLWLWVNLVLQWLQVNS